MREEQPIRVMIVDDHSVVCSGLTIFLLAYDDLEPTPEAGNAARAIQLCRETAVDVIRMDFIMPEMDGAEATHLIRQQCPEVRVIALTSFRKEKLVQGVLQAGTISYLLKNVSADELANAIRAAHAEQPTLAPEATAKPIYAATRPRRNMIYRRAK